MFLKSSQHSNSHLPNQLKINETCFLLIKFKTLIVY